MEPQNTNYSHFLKKAIARKQTRQQSFGKKSLLKVCEEIINESEVVDECDMEVFQILNKTPEDGREKEDEIESELRSMRKSTRTIFDSTD